MSHFVLLLLSALAFATPSGTPQGTRIKVVDSDFGSVVADGRLQVTYDGHPLYRYVGDSPGVILCQDVAEFGGTWLVVQPDGSAVG